MTTISEERVERAALAAKIEGLKEARKIVRMGPDDPMFDLDNGTVVRVCGFVANAIDARIASLEAEMKEGGK